MRIRKKIKLRIIENCMVDSKENYKFDLGVKGLRNDHCDKVSLT